MAVILQKKVTLDECVIDGIKEHKNGCNYAIYFINDEPYLSWGCGGSFRPELLHKWYRNHYKGNGPYDEPVPGFKVKLPISQETILRIKKLTPCTKCGAPFFAVDS